MTVRSTGGALENVSLTFGLGFPEQRERGIRDGHGFDIELPAVLDLLDQIDRGDSTAGQVRAALLEAVAQAYGPADCWRSENVADQISWCRRDGGCPTCERYRARFTQAMSEAAVQWRRWTRPEQYPFAASRSNGLHHVACTVVRQQMPDQFRKLDNDDADALRAFAHRQETWLADAMGDALPPGDFVVPFTIMTDEEARAWVGRNTGPKGGRNYRRCRRCAPTP
ncbi:hypothetical protein ACU686_13230 [Yinghuangia aomiensis]